ncbi:MULTISPECIES: hypothetical protein [unclassified Micromonospora]|uniref:hypothetical protein n=1 Tax=unclassified Micromonospora TaxID=2617518 RepID=UPI0011834895|nr:MULTISPECIES: hypothetical protein [unclassified Micromonospora]
MAGNKWTVARAARYARDARIATAAYLREAPVARTWQISKLMRAHQVHTAHLGQPEAATMLLFGGLGYRPPFPSAWPEAADLIVTDEAHCLDSAQLYVLTPQMCDVVVAAALSLTVEDLQLLDADDLPSPTGLVVLPHPLLVTGVGGDLSDDRAYCWSTPASVLRPDPEKADGVGSAPAVRVSAYDDTHGPVRPDSFRDLAAEARRQGTPLPPLLLDSIRCLPFRYTDGDPQALNRLAAAARHVDGALRNTAAAHGLDESHVEGEYAPDSQIDDVDDTFTLRFLYAFWRLCEQRLTDVAPTEVNHAARLQADRAQVPADVRVVQLRQRDPARDRPTQDRAWQHRWVVRMHKVRQWYPSEQRHKVIYRGPYVKGPAEGPLLRGEAARALVR